MVKTSTLLLFLAISSICFSQSYTIVDTDVSDFYNDQSIIASPDASEPFYGQDSHYSGNEASYIDNNDGTITDEVTGLLWQKNMGEKVTFTDAFTVADSMILGGYNDWRVPSIKELYSLIKFSGQVSGQQAIKFFIDTAYFDHPLGNTDLGEREIDAQTWSSTIYVSQTMNGDETVFGVNFVDGRIKGYPQFNPTNKDELQSMYFRMVRGNTNYGKNNFEDNEDGTITDKATGLMWQKSDDGTMRNWQESLAYAEDLVLADFDNWRLPNAKELHSIVDYTRSPLTTSSAAIDTVFLVTSIVDPNDNGGQYPYFWTSTTHLDGNNPYASAVYFAFGEAQGKMNNELMDVHGAGAQRSDPKAGNISDYPEYFGPQGDVRYVYNAVRCVRNISSTSSVGMSLKDRFTVYPNPAQNYFEVTARQAIRSLQLFNSIGVNMLNVYPDKNSFTVDSKLLPNGAYFLKVLTDQGELEIKKIIVSQ